MHGVDRITRAASVAAVLAAAALAAAGAYAGVTALPTAGQVKAGTTKLGHTLVNANGMTLYTLTADSKTRSACYSTCAKAWPPLTTAGTPIAGAGARQALVGELKRTDGTKQVTYGGHPLYLFVKDHKPGQVNGEGIRGTKEPVCTPKLAKRPCEWYVVSSTTGKPITPKQAAGVPAVRSSKKTAGKAGHGKIVGTGESDGGATATK